MLVWLIIAGVWIIDRLIKINIQSHLVPGQSLIIIPKFFHLTYVLNPGAAFGLLTGRTWILIAAAMIVILGIVYAQSKIPKQDIIMRIAMGMIGGGALGNLYDRVNSGLVVDYLDFRVWSYVFNFADSMIVVGVGLLLLNVYWIEARNISKNSTISPEQDKKNDEQHEF